MSISAAERERDERLGRPPGSGGAERKRAHLLHPAGAELLNGAGWAVSEAEVRALHALLDDLISTPE